MKYLNEEFLVTYDTDYIFDAIDEYILPIKNKIPWGYSFF
jgi:hypothetical protein